MTQAFRLTADQIMPLAIGRGGCMASDRITAEGVPAGSVFEKVPEATALVAVTDRVPEDGA